MLTREDPEVQGMARAMWVSTYADVVEDEDLLEDFGPGPGGDWMDVAPDTPQEAEDLALILMGMLIVANDMSFEALEATAFRAADLDYSDENKEEFGHYLAMEAMGHGVSWTDDHPDVGIKFPRYNFDASELLGPAQRDVRGRPVPYHPRSARRY